MLRIAATIITASLLSVATTGCATTQTDPHQPRQPETPQLSQVDRGVAALEGWEQAAYSLDSSVRQFIDALKQRPIDRTTLKERFATMTMRAQELKDARRQALVTVKPIAESAVRDGSEVRTLAVAFKRAKRAHDSASARHEKVVAALKKLAARKSS